MAEPIEPKLFDLPYSSLSPAPKLDIYWPAAGNGLFPVVISIHGGVVGVQHHPPPVYATLLMLLGYLLLRLATPDVVLRIWTLPLMWLIIGSFLIAAAMTKSGLAQRVAYFCMLGYATSYRSLITLTYVLGFVLGFLIPHPFPRALLLRSLMRAISQKAGMNLAAVGFNGQAVGWLAWAKDMAVPGILASLLMMALHLPVFRQSGPAQIDRPLCGWCSTISGR